MSKGKKLDSQTQRWISEMFIWDGNTIFFRDTDLIFLLFLGLCSVECVEERELLNWSVLKEKVSNFSIKNLG